MRTGVLTPAVGHIVGSLGLLQALVYLGVTAGHAGGLWHLEAFGEHWAADGFCLSFKETLFHSHLLCLYGDCATALLLYLVTRGSGRPEVTEIRKQVPSIVMHGLGHGFLWWHAEHFGAFAARDMLLAPGSPATAQLLLLTLLFAFWLSFFFFLWPLPVAAVQSVALTLLFAYHVPVLLALSAVNAVLNLNISTKFLLSGWAGVYDEYYTLGALLISVPINAAAWAEPLLCDTLLVHWGGHIFFDYTIPASMLLYVFVARALPPRKASKLEE